MIQDEYIRTALKFSLFFSLPQITHLILTVLDLAVSIEMLHLQYFLRNFHKREKQARFQLKNIKKCITIPLRECPVNYRLISLLSRLSKVFHLAESISAPNIVRNFSFLG